MTAFTKDTLLNDGMYIMYAPLGYLTPHADRKFVARFKYGAGAGSFCTFLVKNFSVEEYFAEMASGKAPLQIVEPKGYLLPHIKRMLKDAGYTANKAGFDKYLADQAAYRRAKAA